MEIERKGKLIFCRYILRIFWCFGKLKIPETKLLFYPVAVTALSLNSVCVYCVVLCLMYGCTTAGPGLGWRCWSVSRAGYLVAGEPAAPLPQHHHPDEQGHHQRNPGEGQGHIDAPTLPHLYTSHRVGLQGMATMTLLALGTLCNKLKWFSYRLTAWLWEISCCCACATLGSKISWCTAVACTSTWWKKEYKDEKITRSLP